MTSQHDLRRHYHANEMLEDYALGTLSAEDTAWMQAHIETCPRCQQEIAPLMAAAQSLPFSLPEPGVSMSDDLWDRIEASISHPDASMPTQSGVPPAHVRPIRPTRLMPRQWLSVAALMLISLVGGALLGQVIPQLNDDNRDDPEVQRIAFEITDPGISATGELRYLPDEQIFVLSMDNMPDAPAGYVYQAWLIDEDAPIPVGVMNADLGEFASVGNRDAFQAFAITLEEGPLGNELPTTDPILVASL